jgi:hypothetical protein
MMIGNEKMSCNARVKKTRANGDMMQTTGGMTYSTGHTYFLNMYQCYLIPALTLRLSTASCCSIACTVPTAPYNVQPRQASGPMSGIMNPKKD